MWVITVPMISRTYVVKKIGLFCSPKMGSGSICMADSFCIFLGNVRFKLNTKLNAMLEYGESLVISSANHSFHLALLTKLRT